MFLRWKGFKNMSAKPNHYDAEVPRTAIDLDKDKR